MADRERVAKRAGPRQTNWAKVEAVLDLAPGYGLVPFNQTRVTATGHQKVLGVVPVDKDSAMPRFLGRWDPVEKALDFDLVDRQGRVPRGNHRKRAKPHGHHPTDRGGQRFEVELGPNPSEPNEIIFRGIVAVSLGFEITPATGSYTITGSPARLIHGEPATGEQEIR